MGKYTKGRAEVQRHITDKESYVWYVVRIEGEIVNEGDGMYEPTADEEAKMQANAALIAEAFNVTHETGRTPRQLADERGKLLAALKADRRSHSATTCKPSTAISRRRWGRGTKRGK